MAEALSYAGSPFDEYLQGKRSAPFGDLRTERRFPINSNGRRGRGAAGGHRRAAKLRQQFQQCRGSTREPVRAGHDRDAGTHAPPSSSFTTTHSRQPLYRPPQIRPRHFFSPHPSTRRSSSPLPTARHRLTTTACSGRPRGGGEKGAQEGCRVGRGMGEPWAGLGGSDGVGERSVPAVRLQRGSRAVARLRVWTTFPASSFSLTDTQHTSSDFNARYRPLHRRSPRYQLPNPRPPHLARPLQYPRSRMYRLGTRPVRFPSPSPLFQLTPAAPIPSPRSRASNPPALASPLPSPSPLPPPTAPNLSDAPSPPP